MSACADSLAAKPPSKGDRWMRGTSNTTAEPPATADAAGNPPTATTEPDAQTPPEDVDSGPGDVTGMPDAAGGKPLDAGADDASSHPDGGRDAGMDAGPCAKCGPQEVCMAGQCLAPCKGCLNGSDCIPLDQLHPDTVCQICALRAGAFTWVPRVGASCGDGGGTECDLPDRCDESGQCNPNYVPSTFVCGADPGPCEKQDHCDGHGGCADAGFRAEGSACGNGSGNECDLPDSCDALGQCRPNFLSSSFVCGEPGPCEKQDRCDGYGRCGDRGLKDKGTPCGAASASPCGIPPTCDQSGQCLPSACP